MEILRGGASRLRALATECLPYELPLELSKPWLYRWFDSRIVSQQKYSAAVIARSRKDLLLVALIGGGDELPTYASENVPKSIIVDAEAVARRWRAPASFLVRRNRLQTRKLDLLSIGSQILIAFLYANHKEEILYFAGRSGASLRYPSRSTTPGKALKSRFKQQHKIRELTVETRNRSIGTYNSFFAYESYAFIGEFYDSKRWQALEGHWRFLRRLDVSNCFGSIYTHSFGWATSTDAHSKAHLGQLNGFDSADVGRIFDKVMQASNWGETHGICVGPEFSRIFSEVIFQKIDLDIKRKLMTMGFNSGRYEILRYVDDYFVYVHDLNDLDLIESVVNEVLTRAGFTLNASKTNTYTTPFTTSISQKKAGLKIFLKAALPLDGDLPGYDIREIGVQLRSTMIDSSNDAQAVGATLTQVERRVRKFLLKRASKCADYEQAEALLSYVWEFVHSMLYQYLSNPSVSSVMKLVRTLRDVWKASDLCSGLSERSRRKLEFQSSESLHFIVVRAIRRLCDVPNSDIEICHLLSLASACGLDLTSHDRIFLDLEHMLHSYCQSNAAPRSNQAGMLLLLSCMKYFLAESRTSSTQRSSLIALCSRFGDVLFDSEYLPAGNVDGHASQELFVLALLECPFIFQDEKYSLLCKPWVLDQFVRRIAFQGDPARSARRFLRRCIRDEVNLSDATPESLALSAFVWSDDDFDDLLYEKEPQFVY